jgi:hypothetical protein
MKIENWTDLIFERIPKFKWILKCEHILKFKQKSKLIDFRNMNEFQNINRFENLNENQNLNKFLKMDGFWNLNKNFNFFKKNQNLNKIWKVNGFKIWTFIKNCKRKQKKLNWKRKTEKKMKRTQKKATRSVLLGRPTPARGCAALGPRRPARRIGNAVSLCFSLSYAKKNFPFLFFLSFPRWAE